MPKVCRSLEPRLVKVLRARSDAADRTALPLIERPDDARTKVGRARDLTENHVPPGFGAEPFHSDVSRLSLGFNLGQITCFRQEDQAVDAYLLRNVVLLFSQGSVLPAWNVAVAATQQREIKIRDAGFAPRPLNWRDRRSCPLIHRRRLKRFDASNRTGCHGPERRQVLAGSDQEHLDDSLAHMCIIAERRMLENAAGALDSGGPVAQGNGVDKPHPARERFRVAGRTTWYVEPEEMQGDLDRFLTYYNLVRSHQGYRLKGRRAAGSAPDR